MHCASDQRRLGSSDASLAQATPNAEYALPVDCKFAAAGRHRMPVLAQSLLSRCSVQGNCCVRHRCSWQLPVPRLVLQRWVSWMRPPGCVCGFRHEQERDDYAAPALVDDFELAIWS